MADQAIGESAGYSLTARVLHWVTAVMVLCMIVAGIVAVNEWGGPWQDAIYDAHKSTGALLIPIVLGRIAYRLRNPPPPLPADIPAVQQFAAHAMHYLLYGAVVAQMFLGYIGTSAYRAPVPFYGLFDLPPIWPENRALSEQLFVVHRFLGVTIAVLAAMHIGAALYHHFVRKDRILMRMITG